MNEINCHSKDSWAQRFGTYHWREPQQDSEPYGEVFRTCSYCGSIHPEDLTGLLEAGARMHGSDWKYGWPHKFYIEDIPNPLVGKEVNVGGKWENGVYTPTTGPAPKFSHAKFYSVHISDIEDGDFFNKFTELLKLHSGISWERREDGQVWYRAPYDGYQR